MNKKEIARTKRRYRKKHPAYRKPLYLRVDEDLNSVRIIEPGATHNTTLPAGTYEVRIIANPELELRRRGSEWLVINFHNHLVGAAKKYFKNLQKAGIVKITLGKPEQ